MRRLIVAITLTVLSNCALAEWIKFDGDNITIGYTDPQTNIKTGNMLKVWYLYDRKVPDMVSNGKPYMSIKVQTEYDCANKMKRDVYASFHSKNMGQGTTIFSHSSPREWGTISVGSTEEFILTTACGEK